MSETIRISIPDEADPAGTVIHRFRNFGEDIYRALRDTCSVDIDEIDRCTFTFCVRKIRRSDLGRVEQVIERELARHYFLETAVLVRE